MIASDIYSKTGYEALTGVHVHFLDAVQASCSIRHEDLHICWIGFFHLQIWKGSNDIEMSRGNEKYKTKLLLEKKKGKQSNKGLSAPAPLPHWEACVSLTLFLLLEFYSFYRFAVSSFHVRAFGSSCCILLCGAWLMSLCSFLFCEGRRKGSESGGEGRSGETWRIGRKKNLNQNV